MLSISLSMRSTSFLAGASIPPCLAAPTSTVGEDCVRDGASIPPCLAAPTSTPTGGPPPSAALAGKQRTRLTTAPLPSVASVRVVRVVLYMSVTFQGGSGTADTSVVSRSGVTRSGPGVSRVTALLTGVRGRQTVQRWASLCSVRSSSTGRPGAWDLETAPSSLHWRRVRARSSLRTSSPRRCGATTCRGPGARSSRGVWCVCARCSAPRPSRPPDWATGSWFLPERSMPSSSSGSSAGRESCSPSVNPSARRTCSTRRSHCGAAQRSGSSTAGRTRAWSARGSTSFVGTRKS